MSKDNYDFNAWMKEEDFQSAQKKLLGKKNVIAVGIGYKETGGKRTKAIAIICSVTKKESLAELKKKDLIPAQVKTMLTDVKEVGIIKALKARTDRWRPAPGGVSIGHEWITAGTLGCLVSSGGKVYILSNNHVLADSNNAPIGSAILQLGKHDGGKLIDRIATLEDFVPIKFGGGEGCEIGKAVAGIGNFIARLFGRQTRLEAVSTRQALNRVDAAIALPIKPGLVVNEILELGKITGWRKAGLGDVVKKSGRTTRVTVGEVTQVNVAVSVQYGNGKIGYVHGSTYDRARRVFWRRRQWVGCS